jgi:predicted GNAT superfamily acetyltransferase
MAVEYRKLATDDDFAQASELQRKIFGFSDLDLVSPLMLRLVARDTPPMGLHVGAFLSDAKESRLVGVMLGFATFLERSVYTVLLGVDPDFQDGIYGYRLLLKFRELAMDQGLQTMYGVYDPTNPKLARLYNGGVGFVGTQYLTDKILFRWDFASDHVVAKLNRTHKTSGFTEDDPRPLIREGLLPDADEVLLEIDEGLTVEERKEQGGAVLGEYLNRRGYTIVDCVTARAGDHRKSYYVLRQPHGSCAKEQDGPILNAREIRP